MRRRSNLRVLAVGMIIALVTTLMTTWTVPQPLVSAQDTPPPMAIEFVGSIGGQIQTITLAGNYAYIGEGSALTILDISDPSTPAYVARLPLSAMVMDIAVAEQVAFVVHSEGLQIVDVSNPSAPELRGAVTDTIDGCNRVQVIDNLAYILANDLYVYDVSDLSSPRLLGSYDSQRQQDLYVSGNLAYIATHTGLDIVDIEYPADPRLLGHYATTERINGVHVSGNYAYVTLDSEELHVVDVSTPSAPVLRGQSDAMDDRDVRVVGNVAYLVSYNYLTMYDVSDPANPTKLRSISTGGAYRLEVEQNYAYVAAGNALQVVDVRDPMSPSLHGAYSTPVRQARDVFVSDGIAYIADHNGGLKVVDTHDPTTPTLLSSYDQQFQYAFAVEVKGNLAYIACTSDGLNIIDVSDSTNPRRIGSYDTPGYAHRVHVVDSRAYVADGDGGLQILDVSNPSLPQLVGSYDAADSVYDVAVVGTVAYLAGYKTGLQVLDVSDPAKPALIGSYATSDPISAQSIHVAGNLALLTGFIKTLIFDVSIPSNPVLTSQSSGSLLDSAIVGNLAYISGGGIGIYDVSDPNNPVRRGGYSFRGVASYGLHVEGNLVYVATGSIGLQIFRVNDSTSGDSYETNDTCSQSRSIPVNGAVQHHRFYEAGDIDWARFDGEAGVTYTIRGMVPDGSTANPVLEIYSQCDGSALVQIDPDTAALETTYTATTNGPIFLKLFNRDSATGGANASYDLAVTTAQSTIVVEPQSLTVTQRPGEQSSHTLTIRNSGEGPLTFDIAAAAQTSAWSPVRFPSEKVDLALRQNIQSSGAETFMVYLDEQADLSAAYAISDWEERGQYVYDTLRNTAQESQPELLAFLKRQQTAGHVTGYQPYFIVNAVLVEGNTTALDALELRTDTVYIADASDFLLPPPTPGSAQPTLAGLEWSLQKMGVHQVWDEYGVQGEGVVVANIDTGVMSEHPALVKQYRGTTDGSHDYNWFDPGGIFSDSPGDDNGHGTHTMGTMIGSDGGDHQIGVAPAAQWIAAKGCRGRMCGSEDLIAAAQWILAPYALGSTPDQGDPSRRPHIVNNSWSGYGGRLWYETAVQAWRAADILPVFSAGNHGPGTGTVGSPGDYSGSFAVGATNDNDIIEGFSARGPSQISDETKPDITAPGVNIRSALNDGGYGVESGTSMSSPHIAGCAALIRSAAPTLHVEDIEYVLTSTAVDLGETGPDSEYGYGRVDCYAAVGAALATGPSWLSITPTSGTVAPGEEVELTVTVDTSNMAVSAYTGTITIQSNTPGNTSVEVPVSLTVEDVSRTPTSAVEQASVTPDDGGTVSDGMVWAIFPPNAFDSDLTIIYTGLEQPTHPIGTGNSGIRFFTLKAMRADGQEVTSFQRTFELAVLYTTAELASSGISADELHLITWDEDAGRWRDVLSSVDTTGQRVVGVFDSTGEFALVGGASSAGGKETVFLPLIGR